MGRGAGWGLEVRTGSEVKREGRGHKEHGVAGGGGGGGEGDRV